MPAFYLFNNAQSIINQKANKKEGDALQFKEEQKTKRLNEKMETLFVKILSIRDNMPLQRNLDGVDGEREYYFSKENEIYVMNVRAYTDKDSHIIKQN